ncbi:ligase [Lithospermum erythrorhizon]|uniref:phosphoribosylaminoimidazolesuccinocarboxamide synthase n=1 Tax=Lithospermum erythrorhizon TaxID=34254 RepID=A0AAV3NTK1_LITER
MEFVARGFLTGSTDTSLWTIFKNGIRNYCGNTLPDGALLFVNILTPTTKAVDHDVPVTPNEIVQRGFMNQADLEKASKEIIKERNYN